MKIGVLGGTFDPIHYGHLILARDAMEAMGCERMIFVPNAKSPHKLATWPTPAEVRAAMVRAAISGEPGFEVDEFEVLRGGTSYTIDTIEHLAERNPGAELHYLIGEDNLAELHTWRRVEELLRKVTLLVLLRDGGPADCPHPTLRRRRVDISATEIRERVAKGLSIRYLVPQAVREIIENHQLYREVRPS